MPLDTRRRAALLVAAGALLPLPLLAGCGTDGEDPPSHGAAPDIAAADRDRATGTGTLRWALDAPPATFNAFQADADTGTERITGAVLPALFRLDDRGRPRRDADYLESAEVTATEPRQVVRYKLNPKAVWSSGRRLSAADFIAQWRALRGTDSAYWTARNAGYDRIAEVRRGEGDGEVEVTFTKPYADWRSLFAPLYPRSVTGSPDAFNEGARAGLETGAGPFVMRPAGGGTVTLARNPHWWGDRPLLDRMIFVAVPPEERGRALASRRLDLAEIDRATARRIRTEHATERAERKAAAAARRGADSDAEAAGSGKRNESGEGADRMDGATGHYAPLPEHNEAAALRALTVRKALRPGFTQLAMNGTRGPLADERVRRAVARAIDRGALARRVLGGLGLPTEPLGNHLMVAGQQGYQDNSDAIGGPDTEAARTLLADAGWRPGAASGREQRERDAKTERGQAGAGDAAPAPGPGRGAKRAIGRNGSPLLLRFVLPAGREAAPLRDVGVRIARMLDAVGIGTRIIEVPDSDYFKDHIASGQYDLALYAWPATSYPATDAHPIYAKPQPAADGSLSVQQNYTGVGTDRIDQLLDEASGELDEGAARKLVGRADARIWAAAGSIPLYQRPELVAARSDLVNAGAFGLATPRYQDIGFVRPGH